MGGDKRPGCGPPVEPEYLGRGFAPVNDGLSERGQRLPVAAGVTAERDERLVHGQVGMLREDAFSLLDDDAAVQRSLQGAGQFGVLPGSAVLQDADGRYIGQRLSCFLVGGGEFARCAAEQVQRTDGGGPQSHRNCVHRAEPLLEGSGGELRPPPGLLVQVRNRPGSTGGEALMAGTSLGADLQDFQLFRVVAARCQDVELTFRVDQDQAGGGRVEDVNTDIDEVVHEVGEVVTVDQAVGEGDKRLVEPGFPAEVTRDIQKTADASPTQAVKGTPRRMSCDAPPRWVSVSGARDRSGFLIERGAPDNKLRPRRKRSYTIGPAE